MQFTVTRDDLIRAIAAWEAETQKTPDGKQYTDRAVYPPEALADELIKHLLGEPTIESADQNMKASRAAVYDAIDDERAYQDKRWSPKTTSTSGRHSVGEFVLFMQQYLDDARYQLTFNGEPHASGLALDTVRKVTAMGVACMEQNGVVRR